MIVGLRGLAGLAFGAQGSDLSFLLGLRLRVSVQDVTFIMGLE